MTKKRLREKPRKTNQKPRKAMNDLNQEPQFPTNSEKESIDFTLLHLDSFDSSSITTNSHHTPSTYFGSRGSLSSNKDGSPDHSKTQLPKKLFLDPQETTTTTKVPSLHGFCKIALPTTSSVNNANTQSHGRDTTLPVLRRCISNPCSPPVANLVPRSPPEISKMVGPNAVTTPASKGSTATLPPRPTLRRSVSDLSPSKSYSRSSSSNDMGVDVSPSFEWLRRMRDSMKEINHLWDEIMPCEKEADDEGTEENRTNAVKNDSVTDCEEAVCVEKTGECLIIHFNCPCGKAYQILQSGTNCYYKLM